MAMTSAQSTAFKAASGNLDVNILHLVGIGFYWLLFFCGQHGHWLMSGPAGVTKGFAMLRWAGLLYEPL